MKKILVIEDNPTNMELMIYVLAAYGYETATAMDGEAGCEAAMSETPSLVICDIHLPGIDGYGVLARFKSHPRLREVPIIAVTALAMVGDRDRILASGFDGYISKPIEPEQFVAQVQGFLGHQVSLPVSVPAAPAAAPSPASGPSTHTVLAVDNTPANLQYLEAALLGSGLALVTAPGVLEALRKLDEIVPDLILTDVHMPGLDGFDLIRELRRDPRLREVPFVFLSASYETDSEQRAAALGAASFLHRPIEPEELIRQIRAVLGRGS